MAVSNNTIMEDVLMTHIDPVTLTTMDMSHMRVPVPAVVPILTVPAVILVRTNTPVLIETPVLTDVILVERDTPVDIGTPATVVLVLVLALTLALTVTLIVTVAVTLVLVLVTQSLEALVVTIELLPYLQLHRPPLCPSHLCVLRQSILTGHIPT